MEADLQRFVEAQAVLISGPTASGKSSLALAIAGKISKAGRKPVIVNADSMQIYEGLRILTARPGAAEEARCTHLLYGHVDPGESYSTGQWLRAVTDVLDHLSGDEVPVFVGGTGLYFKALTQGFAAIPDIPEPIRAGIRRRLAEAGPAGLHAELSEADPKAAQQLKAGDSQRIVRALEVLRTTGRSIVDWQARSNEAPVIGDRDVGRLVVMPDRTDLYARIERRFDGMVVDGAVDEVRSFLARGLDPKLPAMKAIGVDEIGSSLRNEISLTDAIALSKQRTRQFAKRQMTWMRNQMGDWPVWSRE